MNPSPPGRARTTSSRRLMGFLVVLVAVALPWTLACRDAGAGDGRRPAGVTGSPEVEAAGGDTLRAWAACTEFVRRRLEDPAGATFPFPVSWGEVLLEQAGRRYSYRDAVTAGSRYRWRCRVRFTGGGWKLEDLRIRATSNLRP